ncbi:hypothetical protein [Fusibacter ferrireducens]|uniref:LysM domain-containing protein n=1 Tax=Fusibacter ferrireducens TaxID=2785058 RepID=A0ABR9ZNJ9_9FIRM|nr:hypothetical protein [Fusibacter ferrireducens]MBF4692048.1 hypothetical protein [Fusibacter ferrireducens]
MQSALISDKYIVVDVVSSNANVTIYRCLEPLKDQEAHYRIHQIKDRALIKYYLKCIDHFSQILPFVESFVDFGDLYLVFKDYTEELAISHIHFNDAEKKDFILKLLAKLSLDTTLPNFIKYTLINSDNLRVDKNKNVHFNVTLDLLNPDSFDQFKSVQKKIATLVEGLTEDHDELNVFIMNCEAGLYKDYVSMLADYKVFLSAINEHREPWIYEKLLVIVLWIKSHFRILVYFSFLLIIMIYGMTLFSRTTAEHNKPYVKKAIGIVHYNDPYSEVVEETETISVYVPVIDTPPVSVEPQKKMHNAYTIYIVPPGDYLYKIALETYGNEKYAYTLANYNGLENPDFLPINYPLKLPSPDQIEALYELMGRP